MNDQAEVYPRNLTDFERDLLQWVLPSDRPGYAGVRSLMGRWNVTARGRRGPGNFILSPLDERVDTESPLPQVLAYGVVETDQGEISVSVREQLGNQIEFEIAKLGQGELRLPVREIRRWTFSTWSSGDPCPKCGQQPREVRASTSAGHRISLAICRTDRRLWVCDERSGVNHPVPVTNFYNELMLHRNVRDPGIALDPKRLFSDLQQFNDTELIKAFRSYNMIRTKIATGEEIVVPLQVRKSLLDRLGRIFKRPSE